jgi:hypothetical protein
MALSGPPSRRGTYTPGSNDGPGRKEHDRPGEGLTMAGGFEAEPRRPYADRLMQRATCPTWVVARDQLGPATIAIISCIAWL